MVCTPKALLLPRPPGRVSDWWGLSLAVTALGLVLAAGCGRQNPAAPGTRELASPPHSPARIVSLAPSITEILFALDLGDQVVGVTRYCKYPPAAAGKAKIGGYFDPNLEAITALNPDLVVLTVQHENAINQLRGLSLRLLTVDTSSVAGILAAIGTIGETCDRTAQAAAAVAALNASLDRVRSTAAGAAKARVLVVLQRNMDAEKLGRVCVAGKDDFYSAIIELAGGVNAYAGIGIKFPELSPEGIQELNPEVILELVTDPATRSRSPEQILRPWQSLSEVAAVRHGRVHLLTEDYATVPGPRFPLLLDRMARLIHPELDWK